MLWKLFGLENILNINQQDVKKLSSQGHLPRIPLCGIIHGSYFSPDTVTSLGCRQCADFFPLRLEGEKVDVEKLQSRSLYERLISKISTKPTAMKKYNEACNTETFHLGW